MIGDLSPPHLSQDDAIAWEGVVIDPQGSVESAIRRRISTPAPSLLEVGHSALTHSLKHVDWAEVVYAAKVDPGTGNRASHQAGLHPSINILRWDANGLPLRDSILDVVILRDPFPGSSEDPIERFLDESLRVLRVGGACIAVSLNFQEGDLASLLQAMWHPTEGALAQAEKDAYWSSLGFRSDRVGAFWRAPGRTILRRVLHAEFCGLPRVHLADQVAVAELSCTFDVFWKIKQDA